MLLLLDVKQEIIKALRLIFKDYKKDKVIYSLSRYENKYMTRTYLRKLADLQIIKRITSSKKNMQYIWNSGDNPNFEELADQVLTRSSKPALSNSDRSSFHSGEFTSSVIKVSNMLSKNGIDDSKIPGLTQEIMKIFYPEHN